MGELRSEPSFATEASHRALVTRDVRMQELERHFTTERKVAHARQMERRSHLAITLPTLVECPHCHEPKLPHRVCPRCGYYKGKAVAGGEEA